MTPEETLRREFYKEFADSHPGDSGIGGHEPQEAIFELTSGDPQEVADWWLSKLSQEKLRLKERVEGMKKEMHYANGDEFESESLTIKMKSYNQALQDVLNQLN